MGWAGMVAVLYQAPLTYIKKFVPGLTLGSMPLRSPPQEPNAAFGTVEGGGSAPPHPANVSPININIRFKQLPSLAGVLLLHGGLLRGWRALGDKDTRTTRHRAGCSGTSRTPGTRSTGASRPRCGAVRKAVESHLQPDCRVGIACLGQQMLERGPLRRLQSIARRHFDVRLDPNSFPVGFRDGIYRRPRGHVDGKVLSQRHWLRYVPSPSRGFPDDNRAFQRLQGIGECLSRGERMVAGEDIDLFVDISRAGHVRLCPGLLDADLLGSGYTVVHVAQVHRIAIEQVRREQRYHVGFATAVVAQIDDDRVRVREEGHGSRGDVAAGAVVAAHKYIQLEVADVAIEVLYLFEAVIAFFSEKFRHRVRGFRLTRLPQIPSGRQPHDTQMVIVGDFLHLFAQKTAEGL